jgi:hypothetical protein
MIRLCDSSLSPPKAYTTSAQFFGWGCTLSWAHIRSCRWHFLHENFTWMNSLFCSFVKIFESLENNWSCFVQFYPNDSVISISIWSDISSRENLFVFIISVWVCALNLLNITISCNSHLTSCLYSCGHIIIADISDKNTLLNQILTYHILDRSFHRYNFHCTESSHSTGGTADIATEPNFRLCCR